MFTVLSSGGQSTHEVHDGGGTDVWSSIWSVLGSEGTIEAVLCGVLYRRTARYTAPDGWIYMYEAQICPAMKK